MSWKNPSILREEGCGFMPGFLPFLLAMLLLTACGPAAPPELEGAINKDKIPVYAPSTLDPDQALAGAELIGDDGAFYAKYWDLKTDDPQEKVVAFYEKALPQAKKEKRDDGALEFHWATFPGAEKGEFLEVICGKGEISIHECLKAGKHKRD